MQATMQAIVRATQNFKHFRHGLGHVIMLGTHMDPGLWAPFAEFFKPEEFVDARDGLLVVDVEFMRKLVTLRRDCNFPFVINSGTRSFKTNHIVGGHPSSAHMVGRAVDIHMPDGNRVVEIAEKFQKYGFYGLGIKRPSGARGYLHLDDVRRVPTIWTYPS